ncbi:MAG: rRNA maturation RNase YbeY [Neisseriaceae bacterium]|nr:rRNA maturation RNase YbeY [Neisseriaceae bacterium]
MKQAKQFKFYRRLNKKCVITILNEIDSATGFNERILLKAAKRSILSGTALVSITLVDEARACALNGLYRGKDYATNVLSFSLTEGDVMPFGFAANLVCGDLILCLPVLEQEAVAQNKTLRDHCLHMVVHGMLHLQGYDHEMPTEAEEMEALEVKILESLGVRTPYLD